MTAQMPAPLQTAFDALKNDINWLHAKWKFYRQLFADDTPGRLAVLNEAAGFSFYAIQDVFWRDSVLHIARLVDRASTAQQDNLCLASLPPLVDDSALSAELETLVATARTICDFAVKWRHKQLAHKDLQHALATAADPLPGISRADMERALLAIRDVMNRIDQYYNDSYHAYEMIGLGPGDGDGMAYIIELGLGAETERRQRLLAELESLQAADDE